MPRTPRTEPRRRAVHRRAESTIDALLTATERLLARDGFARTTTNRIAELAGASIGSLYQYFPNKDALVAALVERRIAREIDLIRTRLAELQSSPLDEAVASFVGSLVDLYAKETRLDRALLSLVTTVDRGRTKQAAEKTAVALLHAHLAARAIAFAPPDLELASFVVVHSVHSTIVAATLEGPERFADAAYRDALVRELTGLTLRYLGATDVSRARERP